MEEEYKLYRVNTKLPEELNEWLDNESRRTGISKSTLIMLSVQAQHDQKTMLRKMGDMGELASKMDGILEALERSESD